jgi:hypothetical protein
MKLTQLHKGKGGRVDEKPRRQQIVEMEDGANERLFLQQSFYLMMVSLSFLDSI